MQSRPIIESTNQSIFRAVMLLGFLSFAAFLANAEDFVEGEDYRVIETEVEEELAKSDSDSDSDSESDDMIKVVEFFNYGCPHCFSLEPIIKDWLEDKGEDVEFTREAVPLRRAWMPLARAYYIAEKFDVTQKVHPRLFKAIFEHNLQMEREDLLAKLFENYGVETEDFQKAFTSDEVFEDVTDSNTRFRLFGLKGTPAVVVAEKYVINTELADGYERMFEIVDFLIEKIRKEKEETS